MISRDCLSRLRQLLRNFPVVCILGPRQCGKTTFIKSALPRWQYLDMEKPSDHTRLAADPEDALHRLGSHFILDEVQQVPQLFPVIRNFVDENRTRSGQIVLLGSASPVLIKHAAETLAGRIGFLDMTPFRCHEVTQSETRLTMEKLWFRGGFPDATLNKQDAARLDWFDAYTRTFIERELTALGIDISPIQMRKLWIMLAHFNGNIWNASKLAASMGTSYHSVNRYTDILEQTFLIRKLPPYFANISKRLIKSPKVYFRDTGLLHYFLNIHSELTLSTHPARGESWEAFIIEELITAFALYVPGTQAYYWRTSTGIEVDLMIMRDNRLIPFEVKLHSSPDKEAAKSLVSCMNDLALEYAYLVYPGDEDYSLGNNITALGIQKLLADPKRIRRL